MSDTVFEITDRSFSGVGWQWTTEVFFRPNSYRTSVMGGPVALSTTVFGPPQRLFEFIELLRCPVRLYDDRMDNLFWGFLNEVQVRVDALEMCVKLDGMANKCAIEYNVMVPGEAVVGESQMTAWASDAVSIGTYGTKELLASLSDVTAQVAGTRRDLLLAAKKYPIPSWYLSGEQGSLSATLLCKGWFSTLDWMYYSNSSGYEAYTSAGEGVHKVGDTSDTAYAAQSFQLGVAVGWYAERIFIKSRKEGAPTDNLRVSLYSDSSGSPGTELAYGLFTGSTMPTDYNWICLDLNTRVSLASSTTYWVVIRRSGSVDPTNHYLVDVNEELGYTRGSFKYGNGSTWSTRSPDADMNFEVQGVIETTQQLVALEAAVGQFITGVKLETSSGVYSCPYREGKSSGLVEALELLKGGTTNNRRMLAEVTIDRILRVYEEPARPTVPTMFLTSAGRVKTSLGEVLPSSKSPAGYWVSTQEAIPPTLDITKIADPTMVFIDEFEYTFGEEKGTIYPRLDPSPWNTGIVSADEKP